MHATNEIERPEATRSSRATTAHTGADHEAFAALYRALRPRLLRYVHARARDEALAEDIVQVTFLHMHAARDRFRPGAPVFPWARTIATRILIDHVRFRGRGGARRPKHDVDELADALPSDAPSAEDVLAAREQRAWLTDDASKLSVPQRQCVTLVMDEGLGHAELATRLRTSVAAVKLRLGRAVRTLRETAGAR